MLKNKYQNRFLTNLAKIQLAFVAKDLLPLNVTEGKRQLIR